MGSRSPPSGGGGGLSELGSDRRWEGLEYSQRLFYLTGRKLGLQSVDEG